MSPAALRSHTPSLAELNSEVDVRVRDCRGSMCPATQDEFIPPKYTINLSLPPERRYDHLAADFASQTATLPSLFKELVECIVGRSYVPWITRLARIALRRVYSDEETAELRGISRASRVEMYLLVAFNVLLDLLMGCTSGGTRVKDNASEGGKMLHFRALDWGMDPLRKIVVELDFVRREGEPVVATSLTYFGYVGVLTGVRKGLSLSLNFRPGHDASTWLKRRRREAHLLLVLLGFRRSISSVLRQYLFSEENPTADEQVVQDLRIQPCTACYLIFCDRQYTILFEKDNRAARVLRSREYMVTLNHDICDEKQYQQAPPEAFANSNMLDERARHEVKLRKATGMLTIAPYSTEREIGIVMLWERAVGRTQRRERKEKKRKEQEKRHLRRHHPRRNIVNDCDCSGYNGTTHHNDCDEGLLHVTTADVLTWMEDPNIANEETHFACVMDPSEGKIIWRRRWLEPLEEDW